MRDNLSSILDTSRSECCDILLTVGGIVMRKKFTVKTAMLHRLAIEYLNIIQYHGQHKTARHE